MTGKPNLTVSVGRQRIHCDFIENAECNKVALVVDEYGVIGRFDWSEVNRIQEYNPDRRLD